jgi:PAS domain S-box-containing protein
MKRSLEIALRYGVAMVAVGAALGIKLLLDPLTVQDTPFLLVFGAIIVSSWYGGLGPGLLATAVSTLATDYFFLYPRGTLTGFSLEGIDVITFMLEGVLVSLLTSSLRSARDRAQRSTLDAKSHEESLRESEERFRLMVEGVKDYAIFMLDPGGHVTTWNDGAEQIEGYGEGEILGRHFSSFYQEEDVERGQPEDVLRAALAEGRYVEEGLKIRKDGSRFWASAVITTLRDRKGNLKGFSMVVHDATERDARFFTRLQDHTRQCGPPRGAHPGRLVRGRRHGGGRHCREARCGAFRPREGRASLRTARALPIGPRNDAGGAQGAQDRRTRHDGGDTRGAP